MAILILLGRLRPLEEVGAFRIGTTYTNLVVALSLFGLSHLLIRDLAQAKNDVGKYFSNFFVLRLAFASLFMVGLLCVLPWLPISENAKALVFVLGFIIIPNNLIDLYFSTFLAKEELPPLVAVSFLFNLGRVAILIFAILMGYALLTVTAILVLTAAIELSVYGVLGRFKHDIRFNKSRLDRAYLKELIIQAAPLFLLAIFYNLDFQLDILLLSIFTSDYEIGVYTLAATIFSFVLFGVTSIEFAIFPAISRWYVRDRGELRRWYFYLVGGLFGFGILLSSLLIVLSDFLLFAVYGANQDVATTGQLLRILAASLAFLMMNTINSRLLIAANRQRQLTMIALSFLAVNGLLYLFLLPRFSIVGAAYVKVISAVLYNVGISIYVYRSVLSKPRDEQSS